MSGNGVCLEDTCCALQCEGKTCGDNGCGGQCGNCSEGTCNGVGLCVTQDQHGLTWISLPRGSFDMGCSPGDTVCADHEKPRHSVALSEFDFLETEVTEAQYLAVTGVNPSCDINAGGGPNSPVECVDWATASAFCFKVGGRLPTEAEWEYASRAGTTTKRYCGDDDSCLSDIGWYIGNSGDHKRDVKNLTPNAWGIHGTLGNICEWTADWYDEGYYLVSPVENPQGPENGTEHVRRGGGFGGSFNMSRASIRFKVLPEWDWGETGIRCVK